MRYIELEKAVVAVLVLGIVLAAGVSVATLFDLDRSSQTGSTNDNPEVVGEGRSGGELNGEVGRSAGDGAREYTDDVRSMERVYPDAESPGEPWFESVDAGLDFEIDQPLRLIEGVQKAGVYVSDFDRDGYEDVLTVGGDEASLYRNTGSEFERTGQLSDVEVEVETALFFDHDNDGYDDLYLLSDERSVFLENDKGSFDLRDVGLEKSYEAVRGAAAADYDGDGCVDLFVIQANHWTEARPEGYSSLDVGLDEDNGFPNRLFDGSCGSFEESTERAGIKGYGWSLATSFVDLTGDGLPDIHVANDFNNDTLYLNNGDGTFQRRAMQGFTNRNGMSSETADVSGNGLLDIYVTNIYFEDRGGTVSERFGGRVRGNNLLLNQGGGEFVDGAERYGVRIGRWGWSSLIHDYDGDGHLDLYHSVSETLPDYPVFFEGTQEGFTRLNASQVGFEKTSSLGAATLDYDRDGDTDVIESNYDGRFKLYENVVEGGNWVSFDVAGDGETTTLGTRVVVENEGVERLRVKSSESDYLSQDSRRIRFGLNDTGVIDEVRVEWPDGDVDVYTHVEANRYYRVTPEDISAVYSEGEVR